MSVQPQTDRKVVTAVKDLASSLPVAGKIEVLNHLLAELDANDLQKLSPEARQALLQVLPAGNATPATVASSTPSVSMELAKKILGTLEIAKDGFAKLTIPANVSDVDAMKALNVYFREKLPSMNRAAIWEGDLDWYAKQSTVSSRDISKERKIEINVLVDGTLGISRADQIKDLKAKGMTLGAPEEVALVVAAYACKNKGKDILKDLWTRTAVSGVALTSPQFRGVVVRRHIDAYDNSFFGASGVRSSSN